MSDALSQVNVLSVTEVTQKVKGALESEPDLQSVWVGGEISNFSQPASGHLYFTLKDDRSRLRCVMFRGRAQSLRFQPQDGMAALLHGSISLYEASGQYQLYVNEMHPSGAGALFVAFEQLKEKLALEGLFDQKRSLPFYPRTVGLISSSTGAAVRDMISVAQRRNPGVNLLIIPAVVQGDTAAPSVAAAIETAQNIPGLDVLIVGRGGGSLEELWAFNEEIVARALFASRIPTISAVGHETDFTIADFVADYRAPTPSVAAEVAVPERNQLRTQLQQLNVRVAGAMVNRQRALRDRLTFLRSSAALTEPDRHLRQARQTLDDYVDRSETAYRSLIEAGRTRLQVAGAKLDSLSPLATLGRGYAICTREDGTVVRRADGVVAGQRLNVRVAQGTIACRVDGRPPRKSNDIPGDPDHKQTELPL